MSDIAKLQPQIVWEIFDRITQVPRPSKKEARITDFLINFAKEHSLKYRKDNAGNIVIARDSSAGAESKPTVILQSHTDMVCEKNSDVTFDFDKDPIQTFIEDGWVKARGTTLGADDGIGMAAALAILITDEPGLPAIEALFTVDEETGLTGAFNLGKDMLTGKYLINLDSEDEGEIFIGCAGGLDTVATFKVNYEDTPEKYAFFEIDIRGLRGGHSGDDIDKGRANSNKLLARFLWKATRDAGAKITSLNGGNLRNAIPREASCIFVVPVNMSHTVFEIYYTFEAEIEKEYSETDPDIQITICEASRCEKTVDQKCSERIIYSLLGIPNGVLSMSFSIPGLVETSSNLASVKQDGEKIIVTTSQRSSVDSARYAAAASVESVFLLAGAKVNHSDGYPGWNPDPSSHLLEITEKCYFELFATKPKVRAIHAGLECGLFLQKYPDLEMISIGPTLREVHSPDEKLEISSVDKFWKLLLAVIRNID